MNDASLTDWIGRVEERTDAVTATVARQMAATLPECGLAPESVADGVELPLLWHWTAFQPDAPMDELGPDGHPKLGGFLPPVDLERRMWAGGRLRFHQPLRVGETLTRRSEILDIQEKHGGAGRMVFVTVAHALDGARGRAIDEEQDIVYIAMPDAYRPPTPKPAPEATAFDRPVPIDTPRLFRYSAATFNAHRIHYDRPYATEVEKYPALVVHGPMQATLLLAAAVRHRGRAPVRFKFRGVHPMFDEHNLRLIGVEDGDALELCTAAEPGGHQGLQARADWGSE
jgi:3-methylfumaryl-CoA hydratase